MIASGIFAELIEARDSDRQLAQYAAVAAGLRRSLDDWVAADRFDNFKSLMARLGLVVEVDCVFEPLAQQTQVVGSEYSPTTRAVAVPFRGSTPGPRSRLHIVVSSRAEWAAEALASAWYSVAVRGCVLRKPLIDHVRFGRALGYPECCVNFFLKHNDWGRQNTLAEAVRRSGSFKWETNCLTKLTPWMLSFHMPCSFDCPETIRYAREVLDAVRAWDAQFADEIVAFMCRPCLALSERFACAFNGIPSGGGCEYTSIEDLCLDAPNRPPYDEARMAALARGNKLKIADATVFIYRSDTLIETLEAKAEPDVIEVPCIFPFE
jgi:hypothetical protein